MAGCVHEGTWAFLILCLGETGCHSGVLALALAAPFWFIGFRLRSALHSFLWWWVLSKGVVYPVFGLDLLCTYTRTRSACLVFFLASNDRFRQERNLII